MINFNELPQYKPANLLPKGAYKAVITEATMKQGADITKPPYLSIVYTLKNANDVIVGKVYDNIAESEKDLMRYKLARFIIALNLQTRLTNFQLKDLAKIIPNRELIVDITSENYNGKDRNIVDVFSGEIYYPSNDPIRSTQLQGKQEVKNERTLNTQVNAPQDIAPEDEIILDEDAFATTDEIDFDDFGV